MANDIKFVLSAEDRTRQAFTSASNGMKALGREVAAFGKNLGVLTGAGLTAFLANAARQAAQTAGQIDKLRAATSLTAEALGELKFAADQTDTDLTSLAKGVAQLSRAMVEAAGGRRQAAAAAFTQLGVALQDAAGRMRDPIDVLQDVAEGLSRLQDPATQTAIRLELFGRAGQELAGFLDRGADGIARLRKEAHELGAVMSTETIDALDVYADNVAKFNAAVQGLTAPALASFAGGMNAIATALLDARQRSEGSLDFLSKAIDNLVNPAHVGGQSEVEKQAEFVAKLTDEVERLKNTTAGDVGRSILDFSAFIPGTEGNRQGGAFLRDFFTNDLQRLETELTAAQLKLSRLIRESAGKLQQDATQIGEGMAEGIAVSTQRIAEEFQKQTATLKAANDEVAAAIERRKALADSFKELIADLGRKAPGLSAGTVIEAIDTIGAAREAQRGGDAEKAIELAEQAREQLAALAESGSVTKQFLTDLAKQAAEVADQAAGAQEQKALEKAEIVKEQLEQLAKAAKIELELDTGNLDEKLAAVAKELSEKAKQNPVVVPVVFGRGAPAKSEIPGLAGGGLIRGPGGPRSDMVPALLSAGEFVVNAAAVARLGLPYLEAVNRAHMPRFADGGLVAERAQVASPFAGMPQLGTLEIGHPSGLRGRVITTENFAEALQNLLGRESRMAGRRLPSSR